jgi:hypothetical protein
MVKGPYGNDHRLWISYDVQPEPSSGYRWSVEGIGPNGFNKQALGVTVTRWGAARKVARYRSEWLREIACKYRDQ